MTRKFVKSAFSALLFLSMSAYAVPNVWQSGYGMGVLEYSLSNSKNQAILISCNESGSEDMDHGFDYYPKGLNGESKELRDVSILLDGVAVVYPPSEHNLPTSTREGANEWIDFATGISKARKIQVYSKNSLVATFKPVPASIKKTAREIADCKPKF